MIFFGIQFGREAIADGCSMLSNFRILSEMPPIIREVATILFGQGASETIFSLRQRDIGDSLNQVRYSFVRVRETGKESNVEVGLGFEWASHQW